MISSNTGAITTANTKKLVAESVTGSDNTSDANWALTNMMGYQESNVAPIPNTNITIAIKGTHNQLNPTDVRPIKAVTDILLRFTIKTTQAINMQSIK